MDFLPASRVESTGRSALLTALLLLTLFAALRPSLPPPFDAHWLADIGIAASWPGFMMFPTPAVLRSHHMTNIETIGTNAAMNPPVGLPRSAFTISVK